MIRIKQRTDIQNLDGILLEIILSPSIATRLPVIRWILALFGAICVLVGVLFALVGAQPVLGFMGIEIVLLLGAYRFSVRNTKMAEHLILSNRNLIFHRVDRDGNISITNLEPRWINVEIFKVKGVASHVTLTSKGRAHKVGTFLAPNEQIKLLATLNKALNKLRSRSLVLSNSQNIHHVI